MSQPGSGDEFVNADLKLFESGDLADATIICGDRKFAVHKLILSSRCKWFKAAFYGRLSEAKSGRIVLLEQDPGLIDMLLRFIYAKDIDIPKLADGGNVPALCVQLFRVGDFFQLDQLKSKATTALEACFDDPDKFVIAETDGGHSPKWLTEILDAVVDAYKDRSTAPIAQTLVKLVYENNTKIFRFPDAVNLLDNITVFAKDLMKNHILEDLAQSKCRLGLPVVCAAQVLSIESSLGSKGQVFDSKNRPCSLYPDVSGSGSVFIAADRMGDKTIDDLTWMAPSPYRISEITSHPDSTIVKIRMVVTNRRGPETQQVLYVRFEHCRDASLHVERYAHRRSEIQQVTASSSADLTNEMRPLIVRDFDI